MSNKSDGEFHSRAAVVDAISRAAKNLPSSVPEGRRDGKLYRVMTNDSYRGETAWETFNKRMDAIFGEDCRNAEGRLENVCRGRFGIDIVTKYLTITIDQSGIKAFHVPMMIKLERLKTELETLAGTTQAAQQAANSSADATDHRKHHTAEAEKVVDTDSDDVGGVDDIGDVEAKKRQVLQAKMRRLAGRLYPEKEAELPGDSRQDRTYKPLPNDPSDSDTSLLSGILDENGNEVIIASKRTNKKRKRDVETTITVDDSDSKTSEDLRGTKNKTAGQLPRAIAKTSDHLPHVPKAKKQRKPCQKAQRKVCRQSPIGSDEDSGKSSALSDGESALRNVEAQGRRKKRGPENQTLQHWNEPRAIVDRRSGLRWSFKCRYCDQ
ncbi:hypothetical protein EDB85DRAFT_1892558 [Lactarius pseudohatsudake]|nr:hypothetical protein EDB85DRAFT_1896661 [Lactarius pseudohatsudake]KAH9028383.1 hypothetical protein EDB85DRAFT_1892558 [Lactarius pseudohatsudake]